MKKTFVILLAAVALLLVGRRYYSEHSPTRRAELPGMRQASNSTDQGPVRDGPGVVVGEGSKTVGQVVNPRYRIEPHVLRHRSAGIQIASAQDEIDLEKIAHELEISSPLGDQIRRFNESVATEVQDLPWATAAEGRMSASVFPRATELTQLRMQAAVCKKSVCMLRAIGQGGTDNPHSNWQESVDRMISQEWWKEQFEDSMTTTVAHNGEVVYLTYFVRKGSSQPQ